MQLVLSKNRIIAHGENFLSMGGVVINTETGAKYENATVAECEGCPSDIDKVGYEYHAGVFVPCAPFGVGNNNGYFMEVCKDCATPRNSGLPIKDIKWSTVGSVSCFIDTTTAAVDKAFNLPIGKSVLAEYSMLRYKIIEGSYFDLGGMRISMNTNPVVIDTFISVGGYPLYTHTPLQGQINGYNELYTAKTIVFEKDTIVPFYVVSTGYYDASNDTSGNITNGLVLHNYTTFGAEIDPLSIKITIPNYRNQPNRAHIVIELEGRK